MESQYPFLDSGRKEQTSSIYMIDWEWNPQLQVNFKAAQGMNGLSQLWAYREHATGHTTKYVVLSHTLRRYAKGQVSKWGPEHFFICFIL